MRNKEEIMERKKMWDDYVIEQWHLSGKIIHVCEKCSLVRWTDRKINLKENCLERCQCVSQEKTMYEREGRTIKEARTLGYSKYVERRGLYERQNRGEKILQMLVKEYRRYMDVPLEAMADSCGTGWMHG